MTDFELMKAILERAECEEDIYFASDESEIAIDGGVTIYFHAGGDIEVIYPHWNQVGTTND